MYTPSPAVVDLFNRIDNKTKWAVASAYRAERQKRYGDYEARWAAIDVLAERHPELSPDDVQKAVGIIIVTAYRNHTEWMNDGVSGPLRDDRVK